jgi:hypothetical protein
MAEVESAFGREEFLSLKGDETWILPIQAQYVIGPGGVIPHSEVVFNHSEVVFNHNERSEAIGLLPILVRLC